MYDVLKDFIIDLFHSDSVADLDSLKFDLRLITGCSEIDTDINIYDYSVKITANVVSVFILSILLYPLKIGEYNVVYVNLYNLKDPENSIYLDTELHSCKEQNEK